MAKPPGHAVYDGRTVSFPSDGSASPGDLVALQADGTITQADDTTGSTGVLSDQAKTDHDADSNQPVHVTGVVITNVASGTSSGDGLAGSTTAGEAGSGDEYEAFSDEGGQFKQHDSADVSLDDGYAAVHLG